MSTNLVLIFLRDIVTVEGCLIITLMKTRISQLLTLVWWVINRPTHHYQNIIWEVPLPTCTALFVSGSGL